MKKFASPRKLALGYARRDWAVLPLHTVKNGICSCAQGASCKRPGKHPRTPNGVKDATTDRNKIKTWWRMWPDANIGVATGSISNVFVLDVDGKVGKASLEALQAKHDRIPTTVTVRLDAGVTFISGATTLRFTTPCLYLGMVSMSGGTGVMRSVLGAPTNREQFIASLLDLAQTRSRWLCAKVAAPLSYAQSWCKRPGCSHQHRSGAGRKA